MTISSITFNTDGETLSRSSSGAVFGIIYVKIDDLELPDKEWNDFVVVVFAWWLNEIAKLYAGLQSEAFCNFMDGPFSLVVKNSRTNGLWDISFYRNAEKHFPLYSGTVEKRQFIAALMRSANEVIRYCRQRKWSSDDINELGQRFSELQQLFKERNNLH